MGAILVMGTGFIVWKLAALYRAEFAEHGRKDQQKWPVQPKDVATRGDLVRAFEFLALRCLGLDAKHRHHLDLANRLGGPSRPASEPRRLAADHLAHLYELARYAPGDEPLAEAELAAARRDLSLLTGAGA